MTRPAGLVVPLARPASVGARRAGLRVPREGVLWLLAAGLLGAAGWFKAINLLLLLAYLMVAVWALNLIAARRRVRGVAAARIPVGELTAGEPALWGVALRAPPMGELNGVGVRDRGEHGDAGWLVADAPPGPEVVLRRAHTPTHRGTFPLEPLLVWSRFPFGLVQAGRAMPPDAAPLVWPRRLPLRSAELRQWLARQTRASAGGTSRERRRAVQPGEFRGLRPFRQGDSPRWVHWRTSARRGELVVMEFEDARSFDLLIVADLAAGPAGEAAADLAAAVVEDWCAEPGPTLALLVLGDGRGAEGGRAGPELRRRLLDRLALAPTFDVAPPVPAIDAPWRGLPALLVSGRAAASADALGVELGRPVAVLSPPHPEGDSWPYRSPSV